MKKHYAAVIPAAGFSSRMGRTKALMEIGGIPVVERLIEMFRLAAVNEIAIVTGHESDEISAAAEKVGACTVYNPDYQNGMFTSVKAGLSAAANADAVFVLPVDIPLVTAFTMISMINCFEESPGRVIYPVFSGKRGHPPLIPSELFREILSYKGEGGLRAVLEAHKDISIDIQVDDSGILEDMDTPDDYKRLNKLYLENQNPDMDSCLALLSHHSLPPHVIEHSRKTSELAADIGGRLNAQGLNLSVPLLRAAGFLHDIAKTLPDHAAEGARLLKIHGLYSAAEITAVHMNFSFREGKPLTEASVLYLADKLLSGSEIRTLQERRAESITKKGSSPEIAEAVNRRFDAAEAIKAEVERILKQPLF